MRRAIKYTALIAAVLIYGQANYVSGFDSGTDSSLCVFSDMLFHERADACDRLWLNSPAMMGTRAWRKIAGDDVPGTEIISRRHP